MDVAYDEGRTWRRAEVVRNLGDPADHPANTSLVFLRAKATDRDGSTVGQAIIRAYKPTR